MYEFMLLYSTFQKPYTLIHQLYAFTTNISSIAIIMWACDYNYYWAS